MSLGSGDNSVYLVGSAVAVATYKVKKLSTKMTSSDDAGTHAVLKYVIVHPTIHTSHIHTLHSLTRHALIATSYFATSHAHVWL